MAFAEAMLWVVGGIGTKAKPKFLLRALQQNTNANCANESKNCLVRKKLLYKRKTNDFLRAKQFLFSFAQFSVVLLGILDSGFE